MKGIIVIPLIIYVFLGGMFRVCARVCSDRNEAARTLVELGADAGVMDSDGQLCISAMIVRMTSVVREVYTVLGGLLR